MGYSTALVLVDVNTSGHVIWHVEIASDDQPLHSFELPTIQGSWLKRRAIEELHTGKEALLGWCASSQVQLGTESLEANVKWSGAKAKPTTWRWKSANLQLLAQSAAPIQIGAQTGFSWYRISNTVRFIPEQNYQRCLSISALQQAILYDVSARRAWLVPLVSIYHHMVLVCHNMITSLDDQQPIPIAAPDDGSISSLVRLQRVGHVVVEGARGHIDGTRAHHGALHQFLKDLHPRGPILSTATNSWILYLVLPKVS